LTPGFVGADIANICNEAALIAARSSKESVGLVDFEKAVDRVIGGLEKKTMVLSPLEKKIVAYHEAGHAVAGWFLEHADPLLKVTIVPRSSGALGFAQYLPKEIKLYQEAQLNDMMCMTLGGRAAEQVFFGKVSTGASDDLKKVTRIAYGTVTTYGMNSKLGNISFAPDGNEQQFTKPYSDKTAETIDEEVREIIAKNYARTIQLLTDKKDIVENLAQRLIKEETVNHDVLIEVMGKRPFSNDAYVEYLTAQEETVRLRKADDEHHKKLAEKKAEEAKNGKNSDDDENKDQEDDLEANTKELLQKKLKELEKLLKSKEAEKILDDVPRR
jgi:cell division protease FtsH